MGLELVAVACDLHRVGKKHLSPFKDPIAALMDFLSNSCAPELPICKTWSRVLIFLHHRFRNILVEYGGRQ